MAIYQGLVYRNIESFIARGFPVLRAITPDERWHPLVRDFIREHSCLSPYFLDIGQEFLAYLENERGDRHNDPPFLLELAHYEWVELALDIAADVLPDVSSAGTDYLVQRYRLSPLAWSLSYRYPVHRICGDFLPTQSPASPTFLVVYRNRDDLVQFLEINAVTARVLQLLQEGEYSGDEIVSSLAVEMGRGDLQALAAATADLLEKLQRLSIILPV